MREHPLLPTVILHRNRTPGTMRRTMRRRGRYHLEDTFFPQHKCSPPSVSRREAGSRSSILRWRFPRVSSPNNARFSCYSCRSFFTSSRISLAPEKPNTIIVMKRLTPSDSQKSYPEEGYKTDQIVRSPRPGLFKYHGYEYNPMRARRYEVYSTSFSTPFLFRGESFQRFDFSLKINIYCFPRFSWMMYPSFARRKRSVRAV